MSLADEIEAGGGTDEAVALALGFTRREDGYGTGDDWFYPDGKRVKRPKGHGVFFGSPPAFLTDLNALAAECERRGAEWCVGHDRKGFIGAVDMADARANSERAPTPARALCAALIRAVESEARDG